MEYYVKSVVPIIESNYNNFTMVEKNIADFFIHNHEKMDFSAKTVAAKLFVSEAFQICQEMRLPRLSGICISV